MKITFWGAAQTVTGSMHHLEVAGKRYLLDCGLYQGRRKDAENRNRDTEAAIVNIGYADGYLRCFAGKGSANIDGKPLPLIGRVSMDLIALDASAAPELHEGDWVTLDYDLPGAAETSGLSQYELLTGLSDRLERRWF